MSDEAAAQTQRVISQRDFSNQIQVQNLLSAIQTLTHAMGVAKFSEEDGTPRYPEAAIAAENSLINTFERLDKIMIENSRWNLKSLKNLENRLADVYEANTKLLEVRAAVEAQGLLPHVRFKPTLMRMGEGWAAIYGSPDFLDKSLVGYGDTPERALKCFDMLFEGSVPQDLHNWLTKQNETKNVDGTGNTEPQTPEKLGGDGG
jgi:hypothetical protein